MKVTKVKIMNMSAIILMLMASTAIAFDVPMEWDNNLPEGLEGTTFIERSNRIPDSCFTNWDFRQDVPMYDTSVVMNGTPDDGIYCFRVGHDPNIGDSVTNRHAFVCWDTRKLPLTPPTQTRVSE